MEPIRQMPGGPAVSDRVPANAIAPRTILRRGALLFVLLALVAGLVLYLLFDLQADEVGREVRANQERAVAIAAQRAVAELDDIASDLRYLAGRPAMLRLLAEPGAMFPADLADDLLRFAREKRAYDRIRLIDLAGRQRLQIDRAVAGPAVLPQRRLDDRLDRAFVEGVAAGRAGEILISVIDRMAGEAGPVEAAPPAVRFATPVTDGNGVAVGILVLDLQALPFLDILAGSAAAGLEEAWLLTGAGSWLLGPAGRAEGGGQTPDREAAAFAEAHPGAWQRIGAGMAAGQIRTADGLFTFARVAPGEDSDRAVALPADPSGWILVSFLPAGALAARRHEQALEFVPVALLLLLVLGGIAFVFARSGLHRSRTESRLRAEQERFRALLESAPDAVVIMDVEGRIVLVNAQTERLFRHSRAQMLGREVEMLVPQDLRQRHAGHRAAFAGAPRVREMGAGLDLMGLRADGTTFPVAISLSPVKAGEELLIVADIRDITERKLAEQRQRASETRFRALLESAPDAVVITDPEGRIVLVNAQTERLFGHRREGLIGREVEILVPQAQRGRHAGLRGGYVAEPRVREMGAGRDLHGLRADGTMFPVAISLSPVPTEEGLLIVADIRDVSDRQRTERQIQELNERLVRDNAELATLNRELEAFSYSVSHDLRAPLRAIDGFSQALIEDCAEQLDDEGRHYLQRVRAAAQRMGQLIDDLLKLSRVSRQELSLQEVDLGVMAGEILEALREAAPERVARITLAENMLAHGDARLLRIALENLLGNAWKFTAGRAEAHIEFGRCGTDGDTAFYVRDNGAGFDMAYAEQLFRAFQRLHAGSEFPGTGIGLATVQRIIHKHGGRVWAEAVADGGATFYFTLQ